ncbi:hypothetical protein ABZ848_18660 [Streptomyces sp. NPDC047081]|uniref:hypothetical protein n=1 Tax=Streptomyces sp. NPDC047081 TaxID=3154706 RepID=UPI0033EFECD6
MTDPASRTRGTAPQTNTPSTPLSSHRYAVQDLLVEAHQRLTALPPASAPSLHELLARLVVGLFDRDQLGGCPPSLGGVVDEAAACLLNLATPQRVATAFDDDLLARLGDLDRLPLPERLRLLEACVRRTRA